MSQTQSPGTATATAIDQLPMPLRRVVKKRKKREARKQVKARILSDREFAKTYFEARSKRSTERKAAFRKKKNKKK